MESMKRIEEIELKQALKDLNNFKEGAYLKFNGIMNGRVTFYKFSAKIDERSSKIILQDKIKDDIIELDQKYISLIAKSEDKRKLELQFDSDLPEKNQTIIIEI